MTTVELWCIAFLGTLLVEVPVFLVGLGSRLGEWRRTACIAMAVQVVTHPTLWFVVPRFEPYVLWVVSAEAGVCVVEGCILGALLFRAGSGVRSAFLRGMAVSTGANLLSTILGIYVL